MRYVVKARVKPGKELALLRAIRDGSLGKGDCDCTKRLEEKLAGRGEPFLSVLRGRGEGESALSPGRSNS